MLKCVNYIVAMLPMKLIKNTKTSEEQTFELIFRRYYVRLCGFANKFIGDTAESEEIVQEAFLNVWKKREKLNLDDDIRPYLFKSVQNLCYNFLEHQKVEDKYYKVIYDVYKNQKKDYQTFESVMYSELQAKVDEVIESLPQRCREIFCLSRWDGLKYGEIAEKLQISVKTVETQMSRALVILRKELSDYLVFMIITLLL
ncbi:RNA polymerase sigma-70 factor [Maribellus comscasis]|uniref:RNA polymerase sigma-70 factor n=2 Tax=Maribellus comscasis TaxID=2681766 RepID=A0A6I6K235_9BACT|nr:RNA polymerase sigma-70 factor [Maribellus comscasis]